MVAHHYLKGDRVVGEQLRYVATYRGDWLALATWCAPALHLKARDGFIGWIEEQRRQHLSLIANNARLCVLPECHYPNLVSRLMKLLLGQLAAGWQRQAEDVYEKHDRPKQAWVQLRAAVLPTAWAGVETAVSPCCTARVPQMRSLVEPGPAIRPTF